MEESYRRKLAKKWHWIPVILLIIMVGTPLAMAVHDSTIVGADSASLLAPSQIHLTWSTNDVYHTMTVSWWTSTWGFSVVFYDTVPHGGVISEYAYRAVGVKQRVADFRGWYHDVELTGLEPGATYYFVCGGILGWSEEHSFRTIGEGEEVSFVLGGDSRRPYASYEIKSSSTSISSWPDARDWVSITMAGEDPDFVVFIGDMVNSGNDQENWSNWLEMVQRCFVTTDGRMIPLVPVIGNHEMGEYPDVETSYEYFTGVFALPENELVPELSELAYSLDFPDLHITVLCSSGACVGTWWDPRTEWEAEAQVEWLNSDLAGSDAEWKVVAFHIPYYSAFVTGTGYASELYLYHWAFIIEDPAYGVDLVATGHVHNYMRSWPVRTTDIVEVPVEAPGTDIGYLAVYDLVEQSSEGVTYIVQGCWGAPTDPYEKGTDCDIRDMMAEAAARPCYTLADLVDGDGLHAVTVDTNGNVLDDFTLPYTAPIAFPVPEYSFVV